MSSSGLIAPMLPSPTTMNKSSVGQSEGLSIPRSSVRFRLKPDNSNSHEFELHRPSNKGTKLLLKVIKAIIIISPEEGRGQCHKESASQQPCEGEGVIFIVI